MIVRKSFKYRLYPNAEQILGLAIQFGHARFVYNYFLAVRQDYYEAHKDDPHKKGLTFADTCKMLTELKRHPEYTWLREADSQVLQASLRNLERAYQNMYEKRSGYPNFKGKIAKQSIKYPQRFRVSDGKVYVPKIGEVKAVIHRPLEGTPKNMTISKTKSGKYFASIQCEIEVAEPQSENPRAAGVDVGLKSALVTSDGVVISAPKHLIKSQKKLARLQRQLSRKKKGSAGREKARYLLARQHEKVANQRADFLHKTSRWLVDNYGFVGVEDLNVKGMLRNHCLARAISDAGWGEMRRQLEYKGTWYGTQIQTIDRFFPSSKTCSDCGNVLPELNLSVRSWECPACGTFHDRDLNAAINIKIEAITRAGIARSHAGGESVSPASSWQFSEKPETQRLHCPADAGQRG
jgi:putative transposase